MSSCWLTLNIQFIHLSQNRDTPLSQQFISLPWNHNFLPVKSPFVMVQSTSVLVQWHFLLVKSQCFATEIPWCLAKGRMHGKQQRHRRHPGRQRWKSPIFEQENHENSWENDGATGGTWMIYGQFMGKWWNSAGNWMLFGQFMGKHETNRFQREHLGFDLYHSCKYDGKWWKQYSRVNIQILHNPLIKFVHWNIALLHGNIAKIHDTW